MIKRLLLLLVVFLLTLSPVQAQETALDRYVAQPDPAFSFNHYLTVSRFGYRTHFVDLTSQRWRTEDEVDRPLWHHDMMIAVPTDPGRRLYPTAVLLIDGGSNNNTDRPDEPDPLLGLAAMLTEMPVIQLKQIPNQPLIFTDEQPQKRTEDEILAYSLDKFLTTADEQWPVHLAMTKAVVRGMDAAAQVLWEIGWPVNDFIVVGGSKRGWTAWLTAAVDPRVRAIVPASIDILNLQRQVDHHWEAYGFYTAAVQDYTEFDLFCRFNEAGGETLKQTIDPYAYRNRTTMPKLILNSVGDQFFLTDASRFYYADLMGPKSLRYSFNTDHTQMSLSVLYGALAWIEKVRDNEPRPSIVWDFDPDGTIVVTPDSPPSQVNLWYADNPRARDFRLESIGPVWQRRTLSPSADGRYRGVVAVPERGWVAYAVEVVFENGDSGFLQTYTTDVRVVPEWLPFAGTHCRDTN